MTSGDALKTLKIIESAYDQRSFDVAAQARTAAVPRWETTGEVLRFHYENRDKTYPQRHFELYDAHDQLLGVQRYYQTPYEYHPEKFHWAIMLFPDHEHHAVYEAGLAFTLDALAAQHLLALTTAAAEDQHTKLAFLHANGFVETMRENESALDVGQFEPEQFAAETARFAESGLRMLSLADLQAEDPAHWLPRLYALESALLQDVPTPDETRMPTIEAYAKNMRDHPELDPSLWMLAADGDELIGLTMAFRELAGNGGYYTGLTGVKRSHRRRGVAMALKVESLRRVKAQGGRSIDTGNEPNNPMYLINLKLGFKPLPPTISYEKRLRAQSRHASKH